MPELPDILLYLHALRPRIVGHRLERVRIISPFVLRTFEPAVESVEGKLVSKIDRDGKRIVVELDDSPNEPLLLVIHLMIAGRLRWDDRVTAKAIGKIGLAIFQFDNGVLHLVESSPKKRASIHLFRGGAQLRVPAFNLLTGTLEDFTQTLQSENHTLKRSLTDPRLFDGVGNAYSDEILHAAKLSPVKLSQRLTADEIARLFTAARSTLTLWIDRLQNEFKTKFPGAGDVTAFRPDFSVHGKFGQPCPACATKIQRIRFAENEVNYCPRCQTGGKLLADRSLSRLLKKDWPATIDEWESSRAE